MPWNWKAALVSPFFRAPVFFAVNLPAGAGAALAACATEFAYRAATAGFYGALTERLSRLSPTRTATGATLIVVPGVAHAVELLVHLMAGTPRIGPAVAISVAMSMTTTTITLAAMRRGLFLTGAGRRTLAADLQQVGRMLTAGVRAGLRMVL